MNRPFALVACCCALFASSCASEQRSNQNQSQNQSTKVTNANSPQSKSDSIFSEIDNQVSIAELGRRLDEVKAIEREARTMVVLRRNWMLGVSQCMRMMGRLKPRAEVIRDDYRRMLSPAGIEIVSAAMNLVGCINCVEHDDDDCRYARDFIKKAERDFKREMRQR
jgi:hypothetical protein